MLTGVQHLIHDLGLIFSYIWQSISTLFNFVITPFTAAAEYVRGFFSIAFSSPEVEIAEIDLTSGALDIVNEIPYFSTLQMVVGLSLIFLIGMATLKSFQRL